MALASSGRAGSAPQRLSVREGVMVIAPLGSRSQGHGVAFKGSTLLFFGESTPRSAKCKVTIDGKETQFDTCQLGPNNTGRMLQIVAEGLDPSVEHSIQILPVFEAPEKPLEVCIESICVAGGEAKIWNLEKEGLLRWPQFYQ